MKKVTVHHVLVHSYSVFLFALVAGLIVDAIYPIRIIPKVVQNAGLILLFLAPLLILWAQRTSGALKQKKEKLTVEDFKKGPYAYTRGPTHLGLALLIIGFGVVANSVIIVAATIIAYIFSKNIFLKEQEEMLAQSYGEEYLKYQKEVNPWL